MVHYFNSLLVEFVAIIMGNTCEIDVLTNPTCIQWRSGRSGINFKQHEHSMLKL